MKESDDFEQSQLREFARRVEPEVTVTTRAVMDWLLGNTLAPADWENFKALARFNNDFQEIYESKEQNAGFYAAYKLFVGVRKCIMWYLNKSLEKKTGGSARWQDNGKQGVFTQEIQLVVRHFIEEVDEKRSTSRVLRISKLKGKKGRKIRESKPDPNLSAGAYTGELDVSLIDINQASEEYYLLEVARDNVFRRLAIFYGEKAEDKVEGIVMLVCLPKLSATKIHEFIHQQNLSTLVELIEKDADYVANILKSAYQRLEQDIHNGTADNAVGLPRGTIAKLVDLVKMYSRAIPKAYFDLGLCCSKIITYKDFMNYEKHHGKTGQKWKKKIKECFREEERLLSYLKKTYGYDDNKKYLFFYHYHASEKGIIVSYEHLLTHPHCTSKHKLYQIYNSILNSQQKMIRSNFNLLDSMRAVDEREKHIKEMINAKKRYESQGIRFFKKSEVQEVLSRFGLPCLMTVYHPDCFVGDLDD